MDARRFNAIFDEVVSPPLIALGFVQQGRRLLYEVDLVQATLARTELRSTPPARFTFLFRHRFLRDRSEQVPATVPTEHADFPVKVAPSQLASVTAGTWCSSPILNRPPADSIDYRARSDEAVREALVALAAQVSSALPALPRHWSPVRIRMSLVARGSARWWIEDLWLDDYDRYLGLPPESV